jgi:hypothetical protein
MQQTRQLQGGGLAGCLQVLLVAVQQQRGLLRLQQQLLLILLLRVRVVTQVKLAGVAAHQLEGWVH